MDLIEVGSILSEFFQEGAGPSHDELDQAFTRSGLASGTQTVAGRSSQGVTVGKVKRVRRIFVYATDNNPRAGLELCRELVALLRADGAFSSALPSFGGTERIARLQSAFERIGFTLDGSGALRPLVVDNLEGTQLTTALQQYVDRLNANPDDASLQLGTGKDLDEAVARHILEQRTGSYPANSNFPFTLAQAFTLLGFAVPGKVQLNSDPHRAVQEALFLLATSVNRLRNDAGTGHGRPSGPRRSRDLSDAEARVVARATALVAGMMLDEV